MEESEITTATAEEQPPQMAGPHDWVVWNQSGSDEDHESDAATFRMRKRVLRIFFVFGFIILFSQILRGCIIHEKVPWADITNTVLLGLLALVFRVRPQYVMQIAWIALMGFWFNTFDGLVPIRGDAIRSPQILMPLLVLYGGWMGSTRMCAISLVMALGLYGAALFVNAPLDKLELELLIHMAILTLTASIISILILEKHRQTEAALRQQSHRLSEELEENLRLSAVMFHDLNNPLHALAGTLELAEVTGISSKEDLSTMHDMTKRIQAIIQSVRDFNTSSPDPGTFECLRTISIIQDLQESIGFLLYRKEIDLKLMEGAAVSFCAPPGVMINSVVSNLITNAVKFTPRGGTIYIRAFENQEGARLEILDEGPGFPQDVLTSTDGKGYRSTTGTEGEQGSGFGLRILALYMNKLNGRLEICNPQGGGAMAAIVLPAKTN